MRCAASPIYQAEKCSEVCINCHPFGIWQSQSMAALPMKVGGVVLGVGSAEVQYRVLHLECDLNGRLIENSLSPGIIN